MSRRLAPALVVLASVACGETGEPAAPLPAPPAPAKIVVTTLMREFDPTAARRDASWVAVERSPGVWTPLASVGTGTYELESTGRPWAIAIACSDEDDKITSVTVHRRSAATMSLAFVLDRQCSRVGEAHTLTGTLKNLPPMSGWFDFGYVDEARGVAIPPDPNTPYELVNVFDGTWDLTFGVRESPGTALTRVALVRREVIATDHRLDVDLGGPSSFAPGTRPVVVRGMTQDENLQPTIRYTAGGAAGLDVGPPDVPPTIPDVRGDYAVFPESVMQPNDRYRGTIVATKGRERERSERAIRFAIHAPIDLDLTLPGALVPPDVALAASSTIALVRTKLVATAGAGARYSVEARVRVRARQEHRWVTTFDESTANAAIDDTMPDLTGVAGFHPQWALPLGERIDIEAKVTEPPRSLGDGTMERATSATSFIVP